ncbi:pentatricopeptide repeat-containing protein [Senna tora]|uniref:Pentatricopeptide repeat-containing protein n=1 Tax=Senna tora TaxID=362788 RepID=A0A834WJ89_9FABA|nr:pentatricopeptide repeat-containing protein [Senna tora]
MWSLRRASLPLRSRGFDVGPSRTGCVKLMLTTCIEEDEAGIYESPQLTCSRLLSMKTLYHTGHSSLQYFLSRSELSSLAGRSNNEENDLVDAVSEPEISTEQRHDNDGNDDELFRDPSDEEEDVKEPQNELGLSKSQNKKLSRRRSPKSELFKAIVNDPGLSVHCALGKWIEEGKKLNREEISLAMNDFRKLKMYGTALKVSEWLETNTKQDDFIEKDYASRLDLIARVRGLNKAKQYIESIPESFRGNAIYECLLANCVRQNHMKVAEEIFNKMKSLELPLTPFSCNKMLILYKRNDKRKIGDVLSLMEKENVRPSLRIYKILIDSKGQTNDIEGMEKIVERMKGEGIEPNSIVQRLLARNYVSAGLKEKAEAVLKKMEEENVKEKRSVYQSLLTEYANLGNADEVGRIWKVCESKAQVAECLVAIEAWGKLKKIEEAEAIFEMMVNKWEKLTSRHYVPLLKVYASHKMVTKGKDLVKRMIESGCEMGPFTLNSVVDLYVEAGEVEEAASILEKAIQKKQMKPMHSSLRAIMDEYARRGDIHNSEKWFIRMRQGGCTLSGFQALIQAYINAKLPAYGIRERMKADNIFPYKALGNQLAQVDAFRNTPVSVLLD